MLISTQNTTLCHPQVDVLQAVYAPASTLYPGIKLRYQESTSKLTSTRPNLAELNGNPIHLP